MKRSGRWSRRYHWTPFVLGISLVSLATAPSAPGQTTCAAPCPAPALAGGQTAASSASASPAPDRREAEVRAVDVELDRAFLWGDKAAVQAIVDDATVSVNGFDDVSTGKEALEQIQPQKSPPRATITASEVVVKFIGDGAVLTAKKTRTFQLNGRPSSHHYRDTNTYVRRNGRWRLVSSVTTSEDPPYSAKDVSFELDFDPAVALGDAKAPLVLYEFSDYECPFCRKFAAETMSRVEKDYVGTGRVAIVFRDNPLDVHPRAAAAAAAGSCAESLGKRWPMSEKLLRDPVALADEDFRRNAREIGLDAAAFDKCIADPATAAKIRRGLDEAARLGVQGTPIFVVGVRGPTDKKVRAIRMIEGARPYENFQTTLDGLLRAAAR